MNRAALKCTQSRAGDRSWKDALVAVDVGTSGARAAAFDLEGERRLEIRRPYPTHIPRPGWAEQDAARWRSAALPCHRPDRPVPVARRARRCAASCPGWAHLSRQPRARGGAPDSRSVRRGGDPPPDRPPAVRLPHRAEAALAAGKRTGDVATGPARPAAAGLRRHGPHRRGRNRRDARGGDPRVRSARRGLGP